MKKAHITFYVIGVTIMLISFIGILVSKSTNELMTSLWFFLGSSLLACGVLLVDKKQEENRLKNKF
jgi:cbb3-type cytochrome oxidase subunit 1